YVWIGVALVYEEIEIVSSRTDIHPKFGSPYANSFDAAILELKAPAYRYNLQTEPTRVRLVDIHAHDAGAFTEGLFFHGDALVESTGLHDKSFIREYRLASPAPTGGGDDAAAERRGPPLPLKEFRFDARMFGEGVASIGDRLYALTYKDKVVLELSLRDFSLLRSHPLETTTGEGWGMTTDGQLLVVSDGSATIQFYDPRAGFRRVRTVDVHDRASGERLANVNELEFVPGEDEILANVWFRNHVLRINATDGGVLEVIDLAWVANMVSNLQSPALRRSGLRHDAVMNGIALHPVTKHVFVTGKLWDSIFELEFSTLAATKRRKKGTRDRSGQH
ncbi:hypothetical protein PybrP1_005460, partial [[Pythium] brassicae (nom. inval.)]